MVLDVELQPITYRVEHCQKVARVSLTRAQPDNLGGRQGVEPAVLLAHPVAFDCRQLEQKAIGRLPDEPGLEVSASDIGDVLLSDVAVRIQLPLSSYATAEGRYNTLANWIERDGSPLQRLVGLVYGQGGVATGSVVANRASNDEYDVDAIIGLRIPPNSDRRI